MSTIEATDFDAILKTVREFISKEVIPREDEIEEKDAVPQVLRDAAAEMGLFGYALPEEHGGLGFTAVQEVRLAFELGRTAPAFRSMFGTNNNIAGQTIVNYGTDEQKRRYLPSLASGETVACFALTEAEAGSDPSGLRTRAVRDGDEYVITGTKRFITNAELSNLLVVFARTDPAGKGTRGISAFLVDAPAEGLSIGPHDQKMGQRGAWTSEVFFDEVRVPRSALVGGEEDVGFRAAMQSLAKGRLSIGALCVGLAERIIEECVAYAKENRQGGRPIGEFQLVQAMLAESQYSQSGKSLLTFDTVEAVRQRGFPAASFQATLNACVRKLPTPVIYLEATLNHKAAVRRDIENDSPRLFTFEEPPPELRAVRAVANEAAQAERFVIPQNMRVPESSLIRTLFENDGERDADSRENLGQWSDSKGKRLEARTVAVKARKLADRVVAIVQPVEPVRRKTKRPEPKSLFPD